ncbi:hypothetical protein EG835_01805 [bacterium]|nr:hypothetical protein [bacterium]
MELRFRLITGCLALVFALTPVSAYAAGTGDDPNDTSYKPTQADRAVEREYQALMRRSAVAVPGDVSIAIVEAPYKYFYTPTHAQETNYWCGPATAQTIDDYWGATIPQSEIAYKLGTTPDGTVFTKLAPTLGALTGIGYVVSPKMYTGAEVRSRIQYGLLTRQHPAAADVTIKAAVWNNYIFDHSGHIIPIEAFDWRYMTVRINDPYNEASWRTGGGATLGHRTYPVAQVQDGILSHFQKVLVY